MSAQIAMASTMTTSAATNAARSFLKKSSTVIISASSHSSRHLYLHPAIPIKLTHPLKTQYARHHSSLTSLSSASIVSRQNKNVARLYARHVLELAAASMLTRQAITRMEQKNLHEGEVVSKPSVWAEGNEKFEERRKRFGETVGQLGSNSFTRIWAAGTRIFNLVLLASPFVVLGPASFLFPNSKSIDSYKWDYALWAVEQAGPTFIKLTQWASTRSDLFSAEFCSRFAKLQDETRGHSWEVTHDMLQNEFGSDYDKELMSLQKDPIGSGCIAQVYRGELLKPVGLHPRGTTVAIKIQHPHILHKVCVDFYILHKAASFLEWIPKLNLDYLSIKDSVDQFRGIMLPQLDLRCEARNLLRFRKSFAGDDDVEFPQPLTDITSEKVLIESFIHGEPIINYLGPEHTDSERRTLATIGLRAAMKMVFLHDFVHGDLHPGNMIINKNEHGNLCMNMIDCGLVVEMGEKEHENLVKILGALIKKDGLVAGQLMVDTARRCQASPLDVQLFCKGIQQIVIDDEQNNFLENVGDYLAEICHLACKHKVKLEASFINAALACEIMEGIASSLYPDMKLQSIALPMVLKAEAMHGLQKYVPSFLS